MSYKRKAELPVGDVNDLMEVTPLGAGSEVGRSCHVLKYKGKTVLVHTNDSSSIEETNKDLYWFLLFTSCSIAFVYFISLTLA